ncbi:MAG: DUF4271 domain-containing protein, partial [Marinilabiliaceae bacterium]
MTTKAHPSTISLSQNQDTILQVSPHPVDVPQKIEIKVMRPGIKQQLEVPEDPVSQTAETPPESQPREEVVQPVIEAPGEPETDTSSPDTLDHVLIADWISSGCQQSLWTSAANDSTCRIFLSYFDKNRNAVDAKADSSQTEAGDTIALGEKTADRVEEMRISDSDLVTKTHYETPLLQQDWFLVVLIALVGLTGLIRFRWNRYLSDVFSVVLFPNVANKLQATHYKGWRQAPSILLGVLFYAAFSVFLFETMYVNDRSFFGWEGWRLLLGLFGFLVVIFTARSLAYRFVGWVFRVGKPTSEYLLHSYLMARAFGVMLMPLVA